MRIKGEIPTVAVPVDVLLEMARLYHEGLVRHIGDGTLKHALQVTNLEQRAYRKLINYKKGVAGDTGGIGG